MKQGIIPAALFFIIIASLLYFFPFNKNLAATIPTKEKTSINPHFTSLVKNFESYFKQKMRYSATPGASLAIIKDDNIYLMEGYGFKKNTRRNKQNIDVNTVFRIGSLSKGFASILAGTYVDKKELSWNDKVQNYIPSFSLRNHSQASEINLKHVLSHSTGLSYHAYTNLIEQGYSMEQIIERFPSCKLTSREGKIYSYQNAIYSVIGEIMKKKSNKDLPSIYQERLFEPLGMKNASVTFEGIANNPNHAIPHKFHKRKRYWMPMKLHKKYYNAIPAGGVNASISDMAQWLQLLLGNREDVISNKVLDEIFTPYINTNNKRKYFSKWRGVKKSLYGLGWRVVERENDTLIYHGGFVNDFKGDILINREEKFAICILSNAPSSLSSSSIATFLNMYDEFKEDIHTWENKNEEKKKMPSL